MVWLEFSFAFEEVVATLVALLYWFARNYNGSEEGDNAAKYIQN